MSIRRQFKVPQNGLFFFESDKTLSILPTNKITKVISGDNTSKGSVVELNYGGVILNAEIIGTHDDPKVLNELEATFLADSQNRNRFLEAASESEDDEEDIPQPPPKKRKAAQKKKTTKSPDVIPESEDDDEDIPQPPPKKRKVALKKKTTKSLVNAVATKTVKKQQKTKELATVVAVYSPAKESIESSFLEEPMTPINDSLASSPTYSLSSLSSISLLSPLPGISSPAAHSTPGRDRARRRLVPPSFNLFDSLVGESPVYERLQRIDDRQDRLEIKIDQLLELMQRDATILAREASAHRSATSRSACVPPTAAVQRVAPVPLVHLPAPEAEPVIPVTPDDLHSLRVVASSAKNFAVRLVRRNFSKTEMYGKNVSGQRGKQGLDAHRVQEIKELVITYFPVAVQERERQWTDCRKAIDSYLRKMPPPPRAE